MTEASLRKKGEPQGKRIGGKSVGGLGNLRFELRDFVRLVQAGELEDEILTHKLALDVARVMDRARDSAGIRFPADDSRLL